MNRRLTSLFAALEALLVVGVGIGIPLMPLTLMWALQYGLTIDWVIFWRAAVDTWLLGHGVDTRYTLDAPLAASSGFPGAGTPFVVTIAPLGFTIITALLAIRAGRRIGETPHRTLGALTGLAIFGALSLGVTLTAVTTAARPSLVQSALLPTLVFGIGLLIGMIGVRGAASAVRVAAHAHGPADASASSTAGNKRSPRLATVQRRITDLQTRARTSATATITALDRQTRARLTDIHDSQTLIAVRIAATGGTGAVALILVAAAAAVAIMLGVNYAHVISLYEAVQSGLLGGVALTIAQLAFIPNLIIWAASWFIGPGFALGTGSAVSPLGTTLGPLPAIPLLGALPTGPMPLAYIGLLVPILAGFLAAIAMHPRLARDGVESPLQLAGAGLGIGFIGGILLGGLAWISSGSAGPGRLSDIGANWLPVGCWGALEIGLAAAIALLVSGIRRGEDGTSTRGPAATDAAGTDAADSDEDAHDRAHPPHR